MLLKFSKENAKLRGLRAVKALLKYLGKIGRRKRKIYSCDLLSGWTCPFAKDCLSKVYEIDGGRKLKDGPHTKFRCFSASQEALYTPLYNLRKHNTDLLKACQTTDEMVELIAASLPDDAGIVRIHVGGDFFNEAYFMAWVEIAKLNPTVLFYAYTKSLRYWIRNADALPDNLVLTASYGGREDHLIEEHGLRYVAVVADLESCEKIHAENLESWNGMPIDHNDSCAANPEIRHESFNLLIHGPQPAGSEAGQSVSTLDGKGSYSRKGK